MSVPSIAATFCGQPVLGDPQSFQAPELGFPEQGAIDSQAQIDAFLGNSPGTTSVGIAPGGRIWLCSGVMIDDSPFDVGMQQTNLLAYAEFNAPFGRPTGLLWPTNFRFWPNCRMLMSEIKFDATVSYAGNRYSANFRTVIRSQSNS